MWELCRSSRSSSREPSQLLDIRYPWVAADLDAAADYLRNHIQQEFEKRHRAADKEQNPETTDGGPKGGQRPKHRPLSDERIEELWVETVSDIVEDTLVFHVDSMDPPVLGQPAGRWRVEKKRTGDPNVDEVRDKGAGVLLDDLGRRRAVFNAEGRRVYSWNPPKAGA